MRYVFEATKNRVYYESAYAAHSQGQYEIDHLIPLELGGPESMPK